jgi:hypothetical protein
MRVLENDESKKWILRVTQHITIHADSGLFLTASHSPLVMTCYSSMQGVTTH